MTARRPQLTGTTSFTLTVDSAAVSPLVISGYLTGAVVDQAYSATVIATGGDGTYNWAVTGLPAGLTATASGGTLTVSGTPDGERQLPRRRYRQRHRNARADRGG